MQNKTCPYSDDYLFYNEETGHYELTEKGLIVQGGVDLRTDLAAKATISPEEAINQFAQTISDMIYQFIHDHNVNNDRQDYLIATIPELRQIILRAMGYQARYVFLVGDLYLSTKPEERAIAINHLAQSVLNNTVRCLGCSILYGGVI